MSENILDFNFLQFNVVLIVPKLKTLGNMGSQSTVHLYPIAVTIQSPRLKKFGKIRLVYKLSLGLIYGF